MPKAFLPQPGTWNFHLSDLPEPKLKREVVDAKLQIEQIIGHPIEHFSCPGGRYDQRTLQMARHTGFATVGEKCGLRFLLVFHRDHGFCGNLRGLR